MKRNPKFIHHQKSSFLSNIRELVFGAQDGMVSTLGALTGIAIGSNNHFFVILSGFVIVAVEATSMGIGSYFSTKSVIDLNKRKLEEEKSELKKDTGREIEELITLYIKDGWSSALAKEMALEASKKKNLFLQEMAYRELGIKKELEKPLQSGIFMFFSYIVGGFIPVLSYLVFPISSAIFFSIGITLFSLFLLGCIIARFTRQKLWKAGLRMFFIAGIAVVVGLVVGNAVSFLFPE